MALTEEQVKLREASALKVLRKRRSIREKAKLTQKEENVKKAEIKEIKKKGKEAQVAEAKQVKEEKRKENRLNLIQQAKLKRYVPSAFESQNKPIIRAPENELTAEELKKRKEQEKEDTERKLKMVVDQKAADTPEEQDIKQRKELRRQLGDQAKSAQPANFVVEKPLAPNAMDLYEAQKIRQRDNIRNARAFAPVQKL